MPSSQPAAGHLAVKPEYLSSQPSAAAKKSEPNRNKSYDPRKPHIADTKLNSTNWYLHVNWLNTTLIVGVPLMGCVAAFWTPLYWQTALWSVVYYFMTGLGITAGYRKCSAFPGSGTLLTWNQIDYGPTPVIQPPYHSAFSLPQQVEEPLKAL